MLAKKIHIVSFDVPWPANYGGAIDVFFKIKALFEIGYKIHLHCFVYNRQPHPHLEFYCEKVSYYDRNISKSGLFNTKPYIVVSRRDEALLQNLNADEAPILFEGLHTTYFLSQHKIAANRSFVRAHNIEHDYYRFLSQSETNVFKRYYYLSEATKLEHYETVLASASGIAAISENDFNYFESKYKQKAFLLPAFHPYNKIISKVGFGKFALYHGNLAVSENEKAALFLVNDVFSKVNFPLVIAGHHPSLELKKTIANNAQIRLVADPSESEMNELLAEAHVHVLPSFQSTGIKLKLLAALYAGRHLLVNDKMLEGSCIPPNLVSVANDQESFIEALNLLLEKEFKAQEIAKRDEVLTNFFSNVKNALILDSRIQATK